LDKSYILSFFNVEKMLNCIKKGVEIFCRNMISNMAHNFVLCGDIQFLAEVIRSLVTFIINPGSMINSDKLLLINNGLFSYFFCSLRNTKDLFNLRVIVFI